MNIADERLQAAAREAARVFPAGGELPPLRLPETAGGQRRTRVQAMSGTGRNRTWLSPLAAAAAVAAVAVAAVLVAPGRQSGPQANGSGILGGNGGAPGVKLTPPQIAVLTGGTKRTWVIYALADNATQKAMERCMHARGLVYQPFYERTAEAATMATLVLGVPGAAFSLAARETRGYGFYAHGVRRAKHPNAGHRPGNSRPPKTRQRYALAAGRCSAAARRLVYGSQSDFRLIATGWTQLQAQLNTAVQADPAFPAAIAKWAACMTAHGYNYPSPDNLWNRLSARVSDTPTAANRALEIRTAVQDYRCAQAVKLVTTIKALQTRHARYVSKAIARNVTRIIHVFAHALKEAKRLHVTGQSGH
jgi:hypothetical protein